MTIILFPFPFVPQKKQQQQQPKTEKNICIFLFDFHANETFYFRQLTLP